MKYCFDLDNKNVEYDELEWEYDGVKDVIIKKINNDLFFKISELVKQERFKKSEEYKKIQEEQLFKEMQEIKSTAENYLCDKTITVKIIGGEYKKIELLKEFYIKQNDINGKCRIGIYIYKKPYRINGWGERIKELKEIVLEKGFSNYSKIRYKNINNALDKAKELLEKEQKRIIFEEEKSKEKSNINEEAKIILEKFNIENPYENIFRSKYSESKPVSLKVFKNKERLLFTDIKFDFSLDTNQIIKLLELVRDL